MADQDANDLGGALAGLPELYSGENLETDARKAVKLFTPDAGGTWWLTEFDPEGGLAFGLCDLGLGFPELGYVDVNELEQVRGQLGLRVEVDLYWTGTLADAQKAVNR